MHILIIPSWYPTPDNPINGIFFREHAQALAQRGHKVGVLFLQLHSLRRLLGVRIPSIGFKIEREGELSTYRLGSLNFFPRFPYGQQWLVEQVGKRGFERYVADHGMPDLVHAHSALYGGVLGAYIGCSYHIPFVLTEHSSIYARMKLSSQQHQVASAVFVASDRLISVSPQLGNLLGKQFPKSSDRWEWIPNIVDVSFFAGTVHPKNRDSRRFIFVNIAFMNENKGQRDLLLAFARSFAGQIDVELWLGGDGPIRKTLEAYATELGVSSQVKFLGMLTRTQVGETMRAADSLVLASHYETFGVVLVEALASGIPVVSTRCGGPESIVGIDQGLLVSVGDIHGLSRAMITIRKKINDYDPKRLRATCKMRYGPDVVIGQLEQLYAGLLGSSSSAMSSRLD